MLTFVQRQPRITLVSGNKVLRFCRRAFARAAMWHSLARQREGLARLDDRLLADIGLTRQAQMAECSKLLWWRR